MIICLGGCRYYCTMTLRSDGSFELPSSSLAACIGGRYLYLYAVGVDLLEQIEIFGDIYEKAGDASDRLMENCYVIIC